MLANLFIRDSLHVVLQQKTANEVLVFANKAIGEYPEIAIESYAIAEEKAKIAKDYYILSKILRDKGLFYEERDLLDSSILIYTQALELAKQNNYSDQKIVLLNDLAIIWRKTAQYQKAKEYHVEALKYAEAAKDYMNIEYAVHGLGRIYEKVGDHEQAIKYFKQSLKLAEKTNSPIDISIALNNLAEAYSAMGDSAAAFGSITRSLEIVFQERDTAQIAETLFSYGALLEHFNKHEESIFQFEKSIEWYQYAKNYDGRAEAAYRTGNVYSLLGNYAKANHFYQICIKTEQAIPTQFSAKSYYEIALIALKEKSWLYAEKNLLAAEHIVETNKLLPLRVQLLETHHQLLTATGRHQQAIQQLENAMALRDSLSQELNLRGNMELAFRYDVEKTELVVNKLQVRQAQIILGGTIIIGTLSILGLGYALYFNSRSKKLLLSKNKEISVQNERLQTSNNLLKQFTYTVAHDLKEPLRSINSFIILLERNYQKHLHEQKEGLKYMDFIKNAAHKMQALISSLIEFNTITTEKAKIEHTNTNEVLERLTSYLLKDNKDSKEMDISIQPNLPIAPIKESHFQLLFRQLLNNAQKFNESKRLILRINGFSDNSFHYYVLEDNGIGIEKQHGKKIFDLFNQIEKNPNNPGTGIGLTICKNIVEKYDGEIWFEPSLHQGTRFWIKLPVVNDIDDDTP